MTGQERLAETVEELELLLKLGALYVMAHYSKNIVLRILAYFGHRSGEVVTKKMERAKSELSAVDFDFGSYRVLRTW